MSGAGLRVRMIPFAPERNEYLQMLAAGLRRGDVATVVEEPLKPAALIAGRSFDLIHSHWPEHVFVRPARGARRAARATAAAAVFAAARASWAARRMPYVHTLHNARPHDPDAPAAQVALLAGLARSADVLVVLSSLAEETARTELRRRGPIVTSPIGCYPWALEASTSDDGVKERKRTLGISDDAPVILLFGQLRADRRFPELVTQVRGWSRDAWLLVAGAPEHPAPTAALRSLASADERLILRDRWVDDATAAQLHGVADLTLHGQRLSLGSGSAILSLSLAVPIVVPARSAAAELGAPPAVVAYESDLRAALERVLAAPRDVRRRAARQAALEQDWAVAVERHREAYALARTIANRRRAAYSPRILS